MAKRRALVIGGTGPTGPIVVEGLHHRGYDVTILHGGQHEVEFNVPGVEHIHEDPHFAESLGRGVDGRTFDLVVAQYGRLRVVSDVFKGKTERIVAIGAATAPYAGDSDERWGRLGRPAVVPDTSTVFVRTPDENKLAFRMVEAMQALMDHHAAGDYSATYVGFPNNYGPRQPGALEWAVIRRILDGRHTMVIADGGLKLESRIYTENAAHGILLVVDNPEVAAGKRYSIADEHMYSMLQRVQFIARHMNVELNLVDMPYDVAWPCHPLWRRRRSHMMCSSRLIRSELGYRDLVSTEVGLARTVDWLLAHRPEPGGELERQLGDPFDYPKEDELLEKWRHTQDLIGHIESPLPGEAHFYRHPKAPGEQWVHPTEGAGPGHGAGVAPPVS